VEDELDPNAASRASHAAILRGLLTALALCEIAAQTGALASVVDGGVAGVLGLPFFAPSLLGTFAAQVLLRPRRAELAAAVALAAVFTWPLYTLVAADNFGLAMAACGGLGLGTIVVLLARALGLRGADRDAVLDVALPALILPIFVVLAYPMVYLTAALWPTTYDHRLYLADAAFGAPLSFVVGRATAAVPLLPAICLAVYVALPLALMLVHALRRRHGVSSSDALVAFVAVTVVGYLGYLAVPVAGPVYAFGDLFPLQPPDPTTLTAAKSLVEPAPRNCMPSLHSAWALLVWWNARPLARGPRTVAALFLAITLLATVALGYHYVVDVVAAFPLTMAAQAWATRVTNPGLRRFSMAAGLTTTAAWMTLVTWNQGMLHWPAAACWLLAFAVVAASSWLERRVYAARWNDAPPGVAVAPPPSWIDRGAGLLLVLLGLAVFLHGAIFSNVLALTFGATNEVRTTLFALCLAGFAVGAAAGGTRPAATARPLRAAALGACALALSSWLVPPMLPWIRDGYLAVAGAGAAESDSLAPLIPLTLARVAMAMPALLPTMVLAGLVVARLAQHLGAGSRRPGHTASLSFGLLLLGVSLGSLATAYAVLPSLSSRGAPLALFVAVALVAASLASRSGAAGAADEAAALARLGSGSVRGIAGVLVLLGVIAGLVATIHLHLLTVVVGDTVYARAQFSFLLCLGLASGALLARRRVDDAGEVRGSLVLILAGLAAAVVVGLPLWSQVPGYFGSFRAYVEQHRMTTNFAEREFVRLCVGGLLLLPPALCVGAAFALGAGLAGSGRSGAPAASLARVLAVGAPAYIVGTLVAGSLLIPMLGSRLTLEATAGFVLLLGTAALFALSARRRAGAAAALATTAVALLLVRQPFDFARLTSGSGLSFKPATHGPAIDTAESIEGFVSVHQGGAGERGDMRRLVVDGQLRARWPTGDSRTPAARELAGLAHARGRDRALVIGVGTGATARILRDAGFAQVVVTEPNAAVLAMARKHFRRANGGALDEAVTSFRALDGRGALVLENTRFDLIAIEAAPITAPGAGSLYTRELYELAAMRLTPQGVLQQQLALEHLTAIGITSVLASARRSFDQVRLYFMAGQATLVACPRACEADVGSATHGREVEALLGIADAVGDYATPLADGGWLDPAAIDRLLESTAGELGVAREALGSKDLEMFFPYHAPFRLLDPYDAPPASLTLLRRFASSPAEDR